MGRACSIHGDKEHAYTNLVKYYEGKVEGLERMTILKLI
jgi:hypothetical protein